MFNTIKLLLFCIVVGMAVACKNNAQKPFGKDPSLEGKQWVLVALNGADVSTPAGMEPTVLLFEGQSNTFGSKTGCNLLNGMYTTGEEDMIKLLKMEVTDKVCPELKTEQAYFDCIDKVTNYKFIRKKKGSAATEFLLLYIDKTEVAKFKAEPLK